jgi:hypothetical protein
MLFSILIFTYLMAIGKTNDFEPNVHVVSPSNLHFASKILNVITFSKYLLSSFICRFYPASWRLDMNIQLASSACTSRPSSSLAVF